MALLLLIRNQGTLLKIRRDFRFSDSSNCPGKKGIEHELIKVFNIFNTIDVYDLI